MQEILSHYLTTFQSLNQGITTYGLAPHKPILVLSILDEMEQNRSLMEQVAVDQQLKDTFQRNWKLLVDTNHRCNINDPLFHLQSEGFWKVYTKDKEPLDKARGISKISHGMLSKQLLELLVDRECRALFRTVILDRYFSKTKANYQLLYPLSTSVQDIKKSIRIRTGQDPKGSRTSVVEGYFRNHFFRQDLLSLYDYTCCISRMRTKPDIGIIEACHIEPHYLNGNSFVTNGIPLCRNLHRAFDTGMIGINKHYEVILKRESIFSESSSLYGIRQLEGQAILLPSEERFYPSLEGLKWHRKRFGF